MKHWTTQEFADKVEQEGLSYAITDFIAYDDTFEDEELGKYVKEANILLISIEEMLGMV